MLAESQRLDAKIKSLQTQLKSFPHGKLISARNGTRYKWYLRNEKNLIYLPKKERKLAEQLAAKKYLSCLLNDLIHEKKAIDFYLRHHNSSPAQSQKLLSETSEYQALLSPYFKPLIQELIDWVNAPYDTNPKFPEQLIHKTVSGNLVRSKSEALIDMMLYTNKIPFRYECALQLGSITLYPDFTIRHPHTGEIYYWEHFGRMDNSSYCQNAYSKLQLYSSHGIIPSIQLITTYETQTHPLSSEQIEQLIHYYFL